LATTYIRRIKIKHNSDVLHQESGKANFDLVYGLEDPREYFGAIATLTTASPSTASASSPNSSRPGARRATTDSGRDVPASLTFAVLMG
jgi:hypothetical protein